MKQQKKWILTLEIISVPNIVKKDLIDRGALQVAFDGVFSDGEIEVVQATAMLQQPVKEVR